MTKLNVLFVIPELHPKVSGGICTYYNELFEENLRQKQWNITVIQGSAYDAQGGSIQYLGADVYFLDKELSLNYKQKFDQVNFFPELQNHLASAWAMYELGLQLKKSFDLVVCTDWGLGFIPWVLTKAFPVITHLHGSIGQIDFYETRPGLEFWSSLYLSTESSLLSYSELLITHSKKNVEFWDKNLIPSKKINLILPLIKQYDFCSDERKFSCPSILDIIVVARIQEWKGPIQLCEALEMLPEIIRKKIRVNWIGKDTFFPKKNCLMSNYLANKFPETWNKNVIPQGEKNKAEIQKYYEQSHVALVCSTWDMFNLSSIEHLQNGKPLICSTGAGVSDFLNNQDNILIYDNSASGLADALSHFAMTSIPESVDFSKILAQFSPQINYQQHHQVMRNCMGVSTEKIESDKFSWLNPKENTVINPREKLLNYWPLKEIMKLLLIRIKRKFNH